MTLETQSIYLLDKHKDTAQYLLEVCKTTLHSHDTIKKVAVRLGLEMAQTACKNALPEAISQIESNIKSFLHSHDVVAFDYLIQQAFVSALWIDGLKEIEQSYSQFKIVDNNLLSQKPRTLKANYDSFRQNVKYIKDNPDAIPADKIQDEISNAEKMLQALKTNATKRGLAIPPSDDESSQTQSQSLEKKNSQLKTPEYKITDDNKRRQAIVIEGLNAVIDAFTTMRDSVISHIPIKTDEEALAWRDGFIDLANNFIPISDDKHRVDFEGWAKTLINIEKYGAEKGLKVSGVTITDEDLDLVDENTLPLDYDKYGKIGLSAISKEHLDSKGILIANCFIEMMNRMSWMAACAQIFSYQAKIRGIRAIAVSGKLSETTSQQQAKSNKQMI